MQKTLGGFESIPIVYVDSICESSYIESINSMAMKKIREMNSEAMIYGSSDITPHLAKSKIEISAKPQGIWIIKSDNPYRLQIFEKKISVGILYNSCTIDEIYDFSYAKCKRTVPHIVVKPNGFELFENELEDVVHQFKYRAER